jgi:uncharacterized protein (TIGR02118 family)
VSQEYWLQFRVRARAARGTKGGWLRRRARRGQSIAITQPSEDTAMIKVSVMYPSSPGARFDHDYYKEKHMPLVAKRLGPNLKSYTIDKCLASGTPNEPAPYVTIGNMFCESMDAFQAGFGPHTQEIMGDIKNYTDITPIILVSEVVVG